MMGSSTLSQLWVNPYVRLAAFLGACGVLLLFFYHSRGAWLLFLLAYAVAYLMNPLVSALQRRGVPRWGGVFASLLVLLVLLGLASLVVAGFVQQASDFVQRAPDIGEQLSVWYAELPALVRRFVPPPLLALFEQTATPGGAQGSALESALSALGELFARVGSNVVGAVTSLIGGVLQAVVLLFLTVFLLYDFPGFNRTFLRAFPRRYQGGAKELFGKLDLSVGGYIRGQFLVSLIVALVIWVGMSLLGVPLAFGIAFLAGVFNLVPFLGPIVAFIPAALLSLTLGWPYLLATAGLFVATNFLDGNVISPLVFSQTVRLHPFTVILSVVIGANLLGVVGALIAVPTAAFLKLLYEDYYLKSRWYSLPER